MLEEGLSAAEEAQQKLQAKPVTPGRYDLVIDATNLWLTWDGTITSSSANARFGLLYNITAPTTYTSNSTATAYLCLYWPPLVAPSNANLGHFEVTTTFALP